MLYEITPDPTITGGTWYSDHEFEAEFVRVLNEQCARLLDERLEESEKKFPNDPFVRRTSSFMSSLELVTLINEMGIATVSLTVQIDNFRLDAHFQQRFASVRLDTSGM